ncbi:MAG: peptidase U62 [Acidobacteria bacterium]|nr:peptidase U62 [Acidobacteriota bacterium]
MKPASLRSVRTLAGAWIALVALAAIPQSGTALPLPRESRSVGTGVKRGAAATAAEKTAAEKSPVLAAMEAELERSMGVLTNTRKADPPAYFIGYAVTDQTRVEVMGSNGALLNSQETKSRYLQVQVRVGSHELDNTRKVGERDRFGFGGAVAVPIEDDVPVLRRMIWLQTDREYREAAEALIQIRTGKEVKAETAETQAPDFSKEKPQTYFGPQASFRIERNPWEERVRAYTRMFRGSAAVLNSIVTFSAVAENEYQANSDGTRLQFGQTRYRLELQVQGKAEDGMDINRYANFDWTDAAGAPDDAAVTSQIKQLIGETEKLRVAPLVEPFAGPVMLTGRAAAVFFHEVFGHRAEGHRQKDVNEGQTFARKVGEQILPAFLSIDDDPTTKRVGKQDLLGHYPYDDEGLQAQRVPLVEKGVLRNFLMSRSPLVGFPNSNGHGRRQVGYNPVARQGNLIVRSEKKITNAELRQALIAEIKKQDKPFGLVIDDIAGGFTNTARGLPQAFQVQPLVVYKVYADGRPDELVRGVDIGGTPLVSLTKIAATGDTPEVFNGYCGAESGWVPVSAVAPAMLITEMEVQKKETSTDKPPILPHPSHDPVKGVRP